jgi:hypothetical protein
MGRAEDAESRLEQVIERHAKEMAAAARSVADAKVITCILPINPKS